MTVVSPACPAWLCETITSKLEMEKEIEELTVNIGNWKIEEEALTTDENYATEDVLYNMMCYDDDLLEDNPTSDENDANDDECTQMMCDDDDQHKENPITDEKVSVAEVSKIYFKSKLWDPSEVIQFQVSKTN